MASSVLAFLDIFRSRNETSSQKPAPFSSGSDHPHNSLTEQSLLPPRITHTLNLLSHSLPLLAELVGQVGVQFHRRDPRHEFAIRVESAAFVVQKFVAGLCEGKREDAAPFEVILEDLAECFENIFVASKVNLKEYQKPKKNWRVRRPALSTIWYSSRDPQEYAHVRKHLSDGLRTLSTLDWRRFSEALATLTRRLESRSQPGEDQALPSTRARQPPHSDHDLKNLFADAFTAMACICQKQPRRELRLRLGTYRNAQVVDNVTVLAKGRSGEDWMELRLHATSKCNSSDWRRSRVKFSGSNDDSGDTTTVTMKHALERGNCICTHIQRHFQPDYWRLNLQIEDHWFTQYWSDPRVLKPENLQTQVSLKALLSPRTSDLSALAGMSLSVILAYSLFYVFGQSWVKGLWNRENIVFFAEGDFIPLRPFFQVSQQSLTSKTFDDHFYRHPDFLELGAMLLEIHFRESLEAMLNMDSPIETIEQRFKAAFQVFDSQRYENMPQPGLRQAVQSCLSLGLLGLCEEVEAESYNQFLRASMLETIVQPLERDLKGAFEGLISTENLDEEASRKLLLPLRPQNSAIADNNGIKKRRSAMADNNGIKKRRPALDFLGQQRSPAHTPSRSSTVDALYPRLDALQECSQEFKLFDVDTNAADTSSASAQTDKWIKRFQSLVETHVLATSKRVKVAVLDTGIDANHPDFDGEDRIKQLETWSDTAARVDKSGHGTHTVSTILWLTQNVDVYVAKISEGDTLKTADHIAEAIRVVSEEWDVDIISMSFGFLRGSRKVSDEIEKALHRRKILFAAASNDGGNMARAYPAKQESVICVHSNDGYGNASSFNPTAQDGTDNFCLVGESIQAAWPSSKPNQSGGTKRMSGTSCATAVAVAVAAFMVGFVDGNMPEHTNWVVPLKSPAGIRAIFRAMSERRTGQYDMVNPVRAFGRGSEHEVRKLLTDIRSRLDI